MDKGRESPQNVAINLPGNESTEEMNQEKLNSLLDVYSDYITEESFQSSSKASRAKSGRSVWDRISLRIRHFIHLYGYLCCPNARTRMRVQRKCGELARPNTCSFRISRRYTVIFLFILATIGILLMESLMLGAMDREERGFSTDVEENVTVPHLASQFVQKETHRDDELKKKLEEAKRENEILRKKLESAHNKVEETAHRAQKEKEQDQREWVKHHIADFEKHFSRLRSASGFGYTTESKDAPNDADSDSNSPDSESSELSANLRSNSSAAKRETEIEKMRKRQRKEHAERSNGHSGARNVHARDTYACIRQFLATHVYPQNSVLHSLRNNSAIYTGTVDIHAFDFHHSIPFLQESGSTISSLLWMGRMSSHLFEVEMRGKNAAGNMGESTESVERVEKAYFKPTFDAPMNAKGVYPEGIQSQGWREIAAYYMALLIGVDNRTPAAIGRIIPANTFTEEDQNRLRRVVQYNRTNILGAMIEEVKRIHPYPAPNQKATEEYLSGDSDTHPLREGNYPLHRKSLDWFVETLIFDYFLQNEDRQKKFNWLGSGMDGPILFDQGASFQFSPSSPVDNTMGECPPVWFPHPTGQSTKALLEGPVKKCKHICRFPKLTVEIIRKYQAMADNSLGGLWVDMMQQCDALSPVLPNGFEEKMASEVDERVDRFLEHVEECRQKLGDDRAFEM